MIGDIYRVVTTFTGDQGQAWQWVWHLYQLTGTGDTPDDLLDEIVSSFDAAWEAIDQDVASDVTGDSFELLLWDAVAKEFNGVASAANPYDGSNLTSENFPANVAPYVTMPTNRARNKAKKFLFGITVSNVIDGALTAGFVAAVSAFADAFTDAVNTSNAQYRLTTFNPVTEDFHLVKLVDWVVGAFSGSQYRRLPGRGA